MGMGPMQVQISCQWLIIQLAALICTYQQDPESNYNQVTIEIAENNVTSSWHGFLYLHIDADVCQLRKCGHLQSATHSFSPLTTFYYTPLVICHHNYVHFYGNILTNKKSTQKTKTVKNCLGIVFINQMLWLPCSWHAQHLVIVTTGRVLSAIAKDIHWDSETSNIPS